MNSLWNKSKYWIIFLLPSLLLGAAVGLYPGYQLFRWTWYDANFCITCHVHDYASVGWANSIHSQKTTCHDCHHQRLRDYLYETYLMLTKPPTFPKDLHHTPYVSKSLCSACHMSNAADRSTITGPMAFEDIEKIPKVDRSRLHSIHLAKQTDLTLLNSHLLSENERNVEGLHPPQEFDRSKGSNRAITCADCHGGPANRGHNFSPVDATCIRCHVEAHETKVGQAYGCRSCHFQEFMIPQTKEDQEKIDKSLREHPLEPENGEHSEH